MKIHISLSAYRFLTMARPTCAVLPRKANWQFLLSYLAYVLSFGPWLGSGVGWEGGKEAGGESRVKILFWAAQPPLHETASSLHRAVHALSV